jgi:hypothetical protein
MTFIDAMVGVVVLVLLYEGLQAPYSKLRVVYCWLLFWWLAPFWFIYVDYWQRRQVRLNKKLGALYMAGVSVEGEEYKRIARKRYSQWHFDTLLNGRFKKTFGVALRP